MHKALRVYKKEDVQGVIDKLTMQLRESEALCVVVDSDKDEYIIVGTGVRQCDMEQAITIANALNNKEPNRGNKPTWG